MWIVKCVVSTLWIRRHSMSELFVLSVLCLKIQNFVKVTNVHFRHPTESIGYFVTHGVLYNKNTIEDFKGCDKQALMDEEGRKIWESITNGSCIDDPSLFVRFFALSFAVSIFVMGRGKCVLRRFRTKWPVRLRISLFLRVNLRKPELSVCD